MKLLRAYYRWNLDIIDGLKAAFRRWPWLAVAAVAAIMAVLQVVDAPLWFQIVEGALGGLAIFYAFEGA